MDQESEDYADPSPQPEQLSSLRMLTAIGLLLTLAAIVEKWPPILAWLSR